MIELRVAAIFVALGLLITGSRAAATTETVRVFEPPYELGAICYKVPPRPLECDRQFQPARTGNLWVGGSKVVSLPVGDTTVFAAHVGQMASGVRFTPTMSGYLSATIADPSGWMTQGTYICIGFTSRWTCEAGKLHDSSGPLKPPEFVTHTDKVLLNTPIEIQALIDKPYSGSAFLTIPSIKLVLTPYS